MPSLTLTELLGMALRKSPVRKIRKALTRCEQAGLPVTAQELEAQHLCGGDPLVLADALATAKELGVSTTFQEMAAICLARHDPMALLLEASKERRVEFDTFSPKRSDRIIGFTRDRREVSAAISVVFRLSPSQLAFGFDFRHIHERLGAAVSVFINTSEKLQTLELRKAEDEAELKSIALEIIPGLRSIGIQYR